ncbi:hypothetical protein J4E83_010935 [Alternaria metachromatica]|uniref:uncharacterized protein n=1 Tax=Alternaria metachromatica TaxID=283354 RepID=UPI0020C5A174|nr:uncharacterized protein J4E83_010935 [Alternaria metachromatica]KAI4604887.1 hypothetical protein J4E83_010935 [Alternaria metachromatica]
MTANRVKVRLVPGCSDGDPLHVPPPGAHTQLDPPTLYLEKIGQQWMESRDEAKPGVQYILEDLPFGYTLWHRPRPSKPSHFDKYLYGHPGKKAFDSPNRFFPHFLHLMNNNGNSIGCPFAPPPPSLAPQHKGRPKKITPGLDRTNVDSEGTPDVYRNLIDKLRRHRDVDEPILEPLSPDWRAEQEHLRNFQAEIKRQDQWVPRTGDIVLYIRNMPDTVELVRDNTTGELQLYDERRKQHLGIPQWAAGLVTEPATGTTVAELASTQERNVSSIGVRVEPIPNPNDPDKSLSKRHKYVLLRQTSPFVMWRDLLRRIPQEDWHDTVKNALALMSTLSLMGKYRFRGSWPNASIYCHGIYVGAEMLAVGDTVRLLPNKQSGQSGCTDVMSIKSIRLKWTNLDKASDNDYDEGRPYNSEIWIYGSAYTSDGSRSNKQWVTEHNVEAPRVANDYADWYPLHPADKELAIPYSRVLGRLHEQDALAYFLKSDHDPPGLDIGRQAVTEARAFARKHDNRIAAESDATWYWGDDRADALNLHTINGLDVSRYDLDRDVKDLRRKYRQLDGIAKADAKPTGQDILNGRGLRTFMAPALPLRTSGAKAQSESGSSMASESHASRKRTHIVDLDDEDDTEEDDIDEEIREHTKVVQDDRERPKKKPKVMVVID